MNQDASLQREDGINEIVGRIERKLDSAQQKKFIPSFNQRTTKETTQFKVIEQVSQKTPSTAAKSQRSATSDRTPTASAQNKDEMGTPAQFKSAGTDEDGNRMSIMPGSARPKTQPKT